MVGVFVAGALPNELLHTSTNNPSTNQGVSQCSNPCYLSGGVLHLQMFAFLVTLKIEFPPPAGSR